MDIRKKTNTTIEYILVSDISILTFTNAPPLELDNNVLDFIKRCPSDLLQLYDSLNFLEVTLRNLWITGYDFKVLNIKKYEMLRERLNKSPQFQLFFFRWKFRRSH